MIAMPGPSRKTTNDVVVAARRELDKSPLFRGRSRLIRMKERGGTLYLEGRLPSYYLKQMLQTVLRNVEGVDKIDNAVAVDWP